MSQGLLVIERVIEEKERKVGHFLCRRTRSLLGIVSVIFAALSALCGLWVTHYAWAESEQPLFMGKVKGNILRGRDVFNGKGACNYCHGTDGYINKPPHLAEDTAALIAKLRPHPPDLRNPATLHLRTDQERVRAIREGHPGTGMFPDTTMTDQDLADTLLYLALIRKDPHLAQ